MSCHHILTWIYMHWCDMLLAWVRRFIDNYAPWELHTYQAVSRWTNNTQLPQTSWRQRVSTHTLTHRKTGSNEQTARSGGVTASFFNSLRTAHPKLHALLFLWPRKQQPMCRSRCWCWSDAGWWSQLLHPCVWSFPRSGSVIASHSCFAEAATGMSRH